MADCTSWLFEIKDLAKDFQIIALEIRAHGGTILFLYLIFPYQIGESSYLNT